MKITYTPNPLATIIELDDHDKEVLRLKLIVDTLTEREEVVFFTEALLEPHCGDCTCVPCSCLKCYAEQLFGINTIKGLRKHEATKIDAAFRSGKTIDEAIEALANYEVKTMASKNFTQEELDKLMPIWRKQARQAGVWLKAYKAEHFNTDQLQQQLADPPSGNV